MRILQISSARHFGGGERHFVDLTNGLTEGGHDIFVAAIPNSPILAELRGRVRQSFFELSSSNPLNFTKAMALRRFVREHAIDIVHAHMARDYPLAALVVGWDGGPRLIITRHVLFPMSKLHRITRRRVARVIAVSTAVASVIQSQGIFRDEQITVVRNGIDLAKFRPRCSRDSSGRFRVGMLGELSPNKGQIDFLRAAEIVAAESDNVEFIIAGRDNSSDGEYGRQLKKLIEASRFRDRIESIERRIDAAEFLSSLDLFVSMSRSEAFGLAIIEAMACGVPVIATETEGTREIVQAEETGTLVPIGDAKRTATAIGALLKDDNRRKRFAANAGSYVTERFSLQRMVTETEAVYHSVR